MNLVQVLLAYWLRHELLDAIPKSVVLRLRETPKLGPSSRQQLNLRVTVPRWFVTRAVLPTSLQPKGRTALFGSP